MVVGVVEAAAFACVSVVIVVVPDVVLVEVDGVPVVVGTIVFSVKFSILLNEMRIQYYLRILML